MEDNEIIKAFECCENNCDCLGCPKLDDTKGCNGVAAEILDLITRQKEQIEALIAGQETLQKYIAEKDKEIERLRSQNLKQSVEIDTLRTSAKTSTIIIENLENKSKTMITEVERLSNINQSLTNHLTNHLTNIRTEAVKEFAERLKERRGVNFPFTRTVFIEDIDNLVKEMVGDAE